MSNSLQTALSSLKPLVGVEEKRGGVGEQRMDWGQKLKKKEAGSREKLKLRPREKEQKEAPKLFVITTEFVSATIVIGRSVVQVMYVH